MDQYDRTKPTETAESSINYRFSPSDFTTLSKINADKGTFGQPGGCTFENIAGKDKNPTHLTFDDPYPQQQTNGQRQTDNNNKKPAGETNYQVAQGDSLWRISERNLEKGSTASPSDAAIAGEVNAIARENNIANPDVIQPGETIRMPEHTPGDNSPPDVLPPGGNNPPHDDTPPGNTNPPHDDTYPGNTNTNDTGTMSGNNKVIMDYFMNKGLTREQAAGIAGNFDVESYANPGMHQLGGGPGRGLAQWEIGGDGRYENLASFAASQGKPVSDMGAQLDFVWHELNTTESASLAALRGAASASGAADVFEQMYERAGAPALAERENYAEDAYRNS